MKFIFVILCLVYGVAYAAKTLRTNLEAIRGIRIVGGEDTTIELYPHQASLHFFHAHLCGASIISARWLVTAAHCTTLDLGFSHTPIRGFTVRIGTSQVESGGQEISVLRVIDHPTFLLSFPQGYDYDISLLYLERDVTFSTTIQPIRLPESDEIYAEGTNATVIGWGVTTENGLFLSETLQRVVVPIVSRERCVQLLNATYLIGHYVTDRMICAGYEEGQYDACGGDSGGPLIIDNTLYGVVSWGVGCARAALPGIYSNVPIFREWIRETTGF